MELFQIPFVKANQELYKPISWFKDLFLKGPTLTVVLNNFDTQNFYHLNTIYKRSNGLLLRQNPFHSIFRHLEALFSH